MQEKIRTSESFAVSEGLLSDLIQVLDQKSLKTILKIPSGVDGCNLNHYGQKLQNLSQRCVNKGSV